MKFFRKIIGKILRKAGWTRENPFVIKNALGHTIFPAELGVIYKAYENKRMIDYEFGDISCIASVASGSIVLDVGANVGFYTLLLARQVGSNGKVFAFEPGPISFALLRANVAFNKYENVTLVNSAVSNRNGITSFYLSAGGESDNTLHDPRDPSDVRDAVNVDVVSLDKFIGKDRVDFVKMDVQGSEYLAMQGMEGIIKNNPDLKILMEYSPHSLESAGVDLEHFLSYIRSFGFEISILFEDGPSREVNDAEILGLIGLGKKYNYVDMLLQRR